MKPAETIQLFDAFLLARDLSFEAVVVGGTALALLGVISRETRDCDVLHPELPGEIRRAALDFAVEQRAATNYIADDWLNNGPRSLAKDLPEAWLERTQVVYQGQAITLASLDRMDLLRSKLFALCDRGIDRADCLALAPGSDELEEIRPWLEQRDCNPDWPSHVRATLSEIERSLSDGV